MFDELGLAGVGLRHDRQVGDALVAHDRLARALHVHARAAVERDDVGAVLLP